MKKAYVCPGPGEGIKCLHGGTGTPRGGRCAKCRQGNLRIYTMKRSKTRHTQAEMAERLSKPAQRKENPTLRQRAKEEIEQARKVRAQTHGIKGALEVVKAMQRMAT